MWLELPDGRRLTYLVEGPSDGTPLVYHHGTPAAGVPWPSFVAAAARHGLRVVFYDRAGYRESSPKPGRSVADVAADVAAVLDALGAGTFLTLGASGGGPHALACAALLPDRCLGAASVAGVAPYGAPGLDWMAGMGADNVEEFGAALAGEAELTRFLEAAAPEVAKLRPADVVAGFGDLLSETDTRHLTPELAEYLATSSRAAVREGIAGWRDDDLAFTRPWGFELAEIRVPTLLWQGAQDLMVPVAHAHWLADRIPGVEAHISEEDGHLSIAVGRLGEIYDWLAGQF
jgi:pimeloyl-ACP methyl ester carboxylesterase